MIKYVVMFFFLAIAASALAQDASKERFQRSGTVDAVYEDEKRIVINDTSFAYSSVVVVRTLSSRRAAFARVQPGVRVGYKIGSDQRITELWLLPANYSEARRRGR